MLQRFPALRRHLAVCGLSAAVLAVAALTQAEVLARGIARLVGAAHRGPGVGAMAVSLVLIGAARAGVAAVNEWSAARTMSRLRAEFTALVLAAARERVSAPDPQRGATLAVDGPRSLETYARSYLPSLTQAAVIPLAAGLRILTADRPSAVIVALTVPLVPLFMVLIGAMTERRSQRSWATMQRLGHHFSDVLHGLATLRLYGRATRQAEQVGAVSERYRQATMGMLRVTFLSAFALDLISTLSVALVAVQIGLRMADGSVALTTGLVVLLLVPDCYQPLRRVGAGFHAAQNGIDAADEALAVEAPARLAVGDSAPRAGEDTLTTRGLRLPRGGGIDYPDRTFRRGEIAVVRGPSGSGKSSLLAALRGRSPIARGAVHWGEQDLSTLDPEAWNALVTWVPQRLPAPAGTVGDAVRAGLAIVDGDGVDVDGVVDGALARVGLAGHGPRMMRTLSGGQARRVQVAHALVAVEHGTAQIVLADEPTAQLDDATAAGVVAALRALAASGATVVVASHDQRFDDGVHAVPEAVRTTSTGSTTSGGGGVREGAAFTTGPAAGDDPLASPATAGAEPVPTLAVLRALVRRVAMPWRRLVLAVAAGIAAGVSTVGLAGLAAWLLLRASEHPNVAALGAAVVGVRAFGVGKGAFRYGERLATHDAGLGTLAALRARLIDHLAHSDPTSTTSTQRADAVRRTVDDVDALLDLVVRAIVPWTATAITVAAAVVATILIDAAAGAALAVAAVVLVAVLPARALRPEAALVVALRARRTALAGRVAATLADAEVHLDRATFGRESAAVGELGRQIDALLATRTRRRMISAALAAAAPLVTVAVTAGFLAGTTLGRPAVGVLLLWPLAILELAATAPDSAEGWAEGVVAGGRIEELFELPRETAAAAHAHRTAGDVRGLDVRALVARWNASAPTIGPIGLRGGSGEVLQVSGPSGAGKSTVAAALINYCPNDADVFRVDGDDRASIDGPALRARVNWVDQQPWIADTTVAANLRIGAADADESRLRAALGAVGLDLDLDRLVGRNGALLSGGPWPGTRPWCSTSRTRTWTRPPPCVWARRSGRPSPIVSWCSSITPRWRSRWPTPRPPMPDRG